MKVTKVLMAVTLIVVISLLTACNKKDDAIPVDSEVETEQQETTQSHEIKDEVTDNSFPVPIHHNGKKVKITDLPEASQAALWWAYDFFNTDGIETEEEFYEFMKEKYFSKRYENGIIPDDINELKFQIAGYVSDMLPEFTAGQKVESFVINIEIPDGLNVKVPMYIKIKSKENMHAVAMSFGGDEWGILGADTKFPMAYH